jgi:hypothetical protein
MLTRRETGTAFRIWALGALATGPLARCNGTAQRTRDKQFRSVGSDLYQRFLTSLDFTNRWKGLDFSLLLSSLEGGERSNCGNPQDTRPNVSLTKPLGIDCRLESEEIVQFADARFRPARTWSPRTKGSGSLLPHRICF